MKKPLFFVSAIAVLAWVAAVPSNANRNPRLREDVWAAATVLPFGAASLFIELNTTDDDAGVQLFLDGEEWTRLRIIAPTGKKLLDIHAQGVMGELGLTELLFESGEPTPDEVLELFPEGDYRIEAKTVEGDLLAATVTLSHEFIDPPEFAPADQEIVDPFDTVVSWDPIDGAVAYEVIVENEDRGVSVDFKLPASKTSIQIPPEFLEPDTEYEAEVLAISANGNKTISESTFTTLP